MRINELNKSLGASILLVLVAIGVSVLIVRLNMRFTESTDCGSFDISAYRLGNVPARCAGYLVN